jgi:hypothetical protein
MQLGLARADGGWQTKDGSIRLPSFVLRAEKQQARQYLCQGYLLQRQIQQLPERRSIRAIHARRNHRAVAQQHIQSIL